MFMAFQNAIYYFIWTDPYFDSKDILKNLKRKVKI